MKQIICKQCNDRGRYLVVDYDMSDVVLRTSMTSVPKCDYKQREVFCNCKFGRILHQLEERTKSPDYVNPFTNLDDEQILCMINRSVEFDEVNEL